MVKGYKNFIFDADDNNIVLKELGTVQDKESKNYGEETQIILGYYSTLEQAIFGLEKILVRRSIKDKSHTLKSIVEEIRKLHDDLKNLIKGE